MNKYKYKETLLEVMMRFQVMTLDSNHFQMQSGQHIYPLFDSQKMLFSDVWAEPTLLIFILV